LFFLLFEATLLIIVIDPFLFRLLFHTIALASCFAICFELNPVSGRTANNNGLSGERKAEKNEEGKQEKDKASLSY